MSVLGFSRVRALFFVRPRDAPAVHSKVTSPYGGTATRASGLTLFGVHDFPRKPPRFGLDESFHKGRKQNLLFPCREETTVVWATVHHPLFVVNVTDDAVDDTHGGVETASSTASEALISDLIVYLERELPKLFTDDGMDSSRFEERVLFEDPITRYDSIAGYLFNIAMLRYLFNPTLEVHSVKQTGVNELTTRWTMTMTFFLLPWQPQLLFTGLSIYGINPMSGKFISHADIWDSIDDNKYFSRQGLFDLLSQCVKIYAPNMPGFRPSMIFLLRRAKYEVRSYGGFAAVAIPCPSPAAGGLVIDPACVRELQRYAEGYNSQGRRLQGGLLAAMREAEVGGRERFLVVLPLGEAHRLPAPLDERLEILEKGSQIYAVVPISGLGAAMESNVAEAEASLRLLLGGEGLQALPGAALATCHALTTPPALARFEIMIPLQGFSLEEL